MEVLVVILCISATSKEDEARQKCEQFFFVISSLGFEIFPKQGVPVETLGCYRDQKGPSSELYERYVASTHLR